MGHVHGDGIVSEVLIFSSFDYYLFVLHVMKEKLGSFTYY